MHTTDTWPIRKRILILDESVRDQSRTVDPVRLRIVSAAVIANPLAGGGFVADLSALAEVGEQLGHELTATAVREIEARGKSVESYGKAAIVGLRGEIEHAAGILHPRFGKAVRARLRGATEIMPSTVKCAGPGTPLDVPLHSPRSLWSIDHFDAVSFCVPDAPLPDEILIAVAFCDGARNLARIRWV